MAGIGVDIAKLSRIASTAVKFGPRFLARAYHPREIAAFRSRLHRAHAPAEVCRAFEVQEGPASVRNAAEQHRRWLAETEAGRACTAFLASRWAAKEALHKALRTERLLFPDVEVVSGTMAALAPVASIEELSAAAAPPLHLHHHLGSRGSAAPTLAFHGAAAATLQRLGLLEPMAPGTTSLVDGDVGGGGGSGGGRVSDRVRLSISHDGDYAVAFVVIDPPAAAAAAAAVVARDAVP